MKRNSSVLSMNININEFVDVLILGDNLTSLNTAYQLKDKNLKIGILCSDKSLNENTSDLVNINILQSDIYNKLLKNFSKKYIRMYLNAQISAMNELIYIVNENKIDCDLKFVSTSFSNNSIGNLSVLSDKVLSFNLYKYILFLKNVCLQNTVKLFSNTKILEIKKKDNKYICQTNHGNIIASKIVNTGGEFCNLLPLSLYFKTYKYNKCIFTNDLLPIVGYSNSCNNSYLISFAYHDQEILNSFFASMVLKDLIIEQENEYIPLLAINRQAKIYHLLHLLPVFYYKLKNFINNIRILISDNLKLKLPKFILRYFM